MKSYIVNLECPLCLRTHSHMELQTLCVDCKRPLLARYNIEAAKRDLTKEKIASRKPDMWRYFEMLPVLDEKNMVSLGEGFTPLLKAERLGSAVGMNNLYMKNESMNPTGSFKDRGLCMAISKAFELGVTEVVVPSAGNAGGSMSAYAARAGMKAHVYMPKDVPMPFILECKALGAEVTLIDGLITDCGKVAAKKAGEMGWFSMSTLKEPYRIEGKKTMGYELAEQLGWELPEVIIYPTGGGTGLIGMWKAFDELECLGFIGSFRPRMISVQAEGCAPIPEAFFNGLKYAKPWKDAHTVAAGLRVPEAVGDFLMLRAINESKGEGIAVSDEALTEAQMRMSRLEGVFACPEGGATLAALEVMQKRGSISPDDRVVLFNTGTGLKYPY